MYFDTKDDSTKYDKDAAYKGFSPEELEFIKNLNIYMVKLEVKL